MHVAKPFLILAALSAVALPALMGCGGSDAGEATEATDVSTVLEYAEARDDGSAVVGAPLAEEAVEATLTAVLEHPEEYAGKRVRLTASIDQVCQASGCWMIVDDGQSESRITFKDYGFFMPKDAAGRTVEMDVEIERTTMSVEEAKHLASETEGEDPDAITEPVETIAVVATGVRIQPENAEGE